MEGSAAAGVKTGDKPPRIVDHAVSQILTDGDAVTLSCRITGADRFDVVWLHNNKEIKPSKDFQYSSEANIHKLHIAEIFPEDAESLVVQGSTPISQIGAGLISTDSFTGVHSSPRRSWRRRTPWRWQRFSGWGGGELTPQANARLIHVIRAFSDVIVGQFYGHRHTDTFRLVYSEGGQQQEARRMGRSLQDRQRWQGQENCRLLVRRHQGIIVLLALRLMTYYFKFIPKACLSSVLVCAVVFMIDFGTVKRLWRTSRQELAVLVITFAVCLLDSVERAVLAGVLAATAVLLRGVMRPAVHRHSVKVSGMEATRVRPTLALIFLNVEHVGARLTAAARARPHAPLLLHCGALSLIDDASRQALERLVKKFKSVDQKLIAYNASPEVLKSLQQVEGLEQRALGASTVLEALMAVADSGEHVVETTALLSEK